MGFWSRAILAVSLLLGGILFVQAQTYAKRMCYQCHMPFQCSTGFCYGDFCVKSLVGDKYVSKGCENKSTKSVSSEENSGADVGCLESEVFGVANTVCYCNDVDFCNGAFSPNTPALSLLLLICSVWLR